MSRIPLVSVLALLSCTTVADIGGYSLVPGYPFASRAGRAITDTPDGHANRTSDPVYMRNWDIDCSAGEPMGAMVSGWVTVAESSSNTGYGRQVCVHDPDSGLDVCQSHMNAVEVVKDLWVNRGERIGTCGTTGAVYPMNGGDGSHVDVFARDTWGNPVELPHPDAWDPLATLVAPGTSEPEGSILVTAPTAGQWLRVGETSTIAWQAEGFGGLVRIELYRGGTAPEDVCLQLAATEPADAGTYPFAPLERMGACEVDDGCGWRVGISEATSGTPSAFSGSFCIESATVEPDEPEAGILAEGTVLCVVDAFSSTDPGPFEAVGQGVGSWSYDGSHPAWRDGDRVCRDFDDSGSYLVSFASASGAWADYGDWCWESRDAFCSWDDNNESYGIGFASDGEELVPVAGDEGP